MRTGKVSAFMLEKYQLGELSPEDQEMIKEALAVDSSLQERLKTLDESDRELRLRYPLESFRLPPPRFTRIRTARLAGLAALIIAGILVPVLYGVLSTAAESTDRIKGTAQTNSELLIYVKGEEIFLADQTALQEGNTVQLAYTAPVGEHYGVIFSIDGRSEVTMHFPYWKGQSSLLESGRRIFLNEAYTLDDAPDFEVFVMVVSQEPLDAETVLWEARKTTEKSFKDQGSYEDKIRTAFQGCQVEMLKMLKKSTSPRTSGS